MRLILKNLFMKSVDSVNPYSLITFAIKLDVKKNEVRICDQIYNANLNYHVVGFGKAVVGMAEAVQKVLQHRIISGVLSIPSKTANTSLTNIKYLTGAHNNLPDDKSVAATEEIIRQVESIPQEDIIIILISGGGSSLLCKPVPGITLEDKLFTIRQLVASGADICELNTVRKVLSQIKGGGLGKLLGRRKTISLILSDVVGDDLQVIASAPTVANSDSSLAAFSVIKKYNLELKVPENVLHVIRNPKIIDIIGENVQNRIIGSNKLALQTILLEMTKNCKKVLVSHSIQGLVTVIAEAYLKLTLHILHFLTCKNRNIFIENLSLWMRKYSSLQLEPSFINNIVDVSKEGSEDTILLLMGGETTVEISGQGVGGRNQELAVTFARDLYKAKEHEPSLIANWDVALLCAGTDGIDGPTDAAGAIGCYDLIQEGLENQLDVDEYLKNNNTYSYLNAIANSKFLVKTGHTGTNVMDIHILAIRKKR